MTCGRVDASGNGVFFLAFIDGSNAFLLFTFPFFVRSCVRMVCVTIFVTY